MLSNAYLNDLSICVSVQEKSGMRMYSYLRIFAPINFIVIDLSDFHTLFQ